MFPRFARIGLASIRPLALTLSLTALSACAAAKRAPIASVTSSLATAPTAARLPAAFAPRSFTVKVSGHGAPMILIPGLACSGAVWDDFVRHYADRYEMHVLTLAGFGGAPAVPEATLAMVRDELARYIQSAGMKKPIIVGHSLGGALAFALAERAPESVGAVVAVDGVPFLPALLNPAATAEGMAAPRGCSPIHSRRHLRRRFARRTALRSRPW